MISPLAIDAALLAKVAAEAAVSPRLRKNRNFHAGNESACHRLLNALQPGTYIRPHRHLDPSKEETMLMLSGSMGCLLFDDEGRVMQTLVLSADGPVRGVNIPVGRFHSLVALRPDSVFFEAKAGPYLALGNEETAAWAPAEGEAGAAAYLAQLASHFA